MRYCPKCDKMLAYDATSCLDCSQSPSKKKVMTERPSKSSSVSQFCPKCNNMLAYDATKCQHCIQNQKKQQASPVQNQQNTHVEYVKQASPSHHQPSATAERNDCFCTGCGSRLEAGKLFCPNCGTKQGGVSPPRPHGSVGIDIDFQSQVTGVGAVALIIMLLQRVVSIPIFQSIPSFFLEFLRFELGGAVGTLTGWFSFYEFMRVSWALYRAMAEDGVDEGIFLVLIAGLSFAFMVLCIIALAYYVYSLVKRKKNAQQIGKTSYLLTFIFGIVVIALVLLINQAAASELGETGQMFGLIMDTRVFALRGIFYIMTVLAGIGLFVGFKKL